MTIFVGVDKVAYNESSVLILSYKCTLLIEWIPDNLKMFEVVPESLEEILLLCFVYFHIAKCNSQ
jgi:hypothetical protein